MSDHRYRWRPGQIIIPSVLILLGLLFLLSNFDVIPWGWLSLWRLWPIILILLGLEVILTRASIGATLVIALLLILFFIAVGFFLGAPWGYWGGWQEGETVHLTQSVGDISEAKVVLQFGAGTLNLQALPQPSASLMEGDFSGGRPNMDFRESKGKGELTLSGERRWTFFERSPDWNWNLGLHPDIPLDLRAQVGAARANLDLRELLVRELNLDLGASSATVVFSERAGATTATVKAGAARLVLEVPEGVAARIEAEVGLSSFTVDQEQFPKSDGIYVSPDFDQWPHKLYLYIDTGVSSITIK